MTGILGKSEGIEIEQNRVRENLQKAGRGSYNVTRPSGFVNWCLSGGETNFCIFMTGGSDVRS